MGAGQINQPVYLEEYADGRRQLVDAAGTPAAPDSADFYAVKTQLNNDELKTDAFVNIFGPTDANGFTFGETTALGHKLAFDWTTSIKWEMETSFRAVRIVAWNRMDNALNLKGLVGVTETGLTTNTTQRTVPRINGVDYAQLAPANTVNGFKQVTWASVSSVTIPTAAIAHQVSISDRIALSSVPRLAGQNNTRPLLLTRLFTNGATAASAPFVAASPWVPSNLSIAAGTNLTTLRGRAYQQSGAGADYVNSPLAIPDNVTPNACIEHGVIVTFERPVLSVWMAGDSLGYMPTVAIQSQYINSFAMRACAEVSTPTKPVVFANLAAAGAPALKSLALVRQYLAAGCPAPSVLIVNPVSANDDQSNWATEGNAAVQRVLDLAMDWIRLCRQNGIVHLLWYGLFPRESAPLAGDNIRKQLNTTIRDIAAMNGVQFLNFVVGDGASPERFISAYDSGDGLHQNELANNTILPDLLVTYLRTLVRQ